MFYRNIFFVIILEIETILYNFRNLSSFLNNDIYELLLNKLIQ